MNQPLSRRVIVQTFANTILCSKTHFQEVSIMSTGV
jgi:hypothetical protein